MPFKDGTGPMGLGARTGRNLGVCKAYENAGLGLGCRHGFGHGAGVSNAGDVAGKISREQLEVQKVWLERRLGMVNKQLENDQ